MYIYVYFNLGKVYDYTIKKYKHIATFFILHRISFLVSNHSKTILRFLKETLEEYCGNEYPVNLN